MGRLLVAFAIVAVMMPGCANPLVDLDGKTTDADSRELVPALVSVSPAVPAIGDTLTLQFTHPIDPASVDAGSITLSRTDKTDSLPFTFSVTGSTIQVSPIYQAYLNPSANLASSGEWNGILNTGLKPDTSYAISVSSRVRTTGGAAISGNRSASFRTADLDIGLYWYGPGNRFEKYVPGKPNPYYDPSRKTYVFFHGWQGGTTVDDFRKEIPFWQNTKFAPNVNSLAAMLQAGWNVGAFAWGQFADEDEVKDAEAKIWKGANNWKGKDGTTVNMRYKVRGGAFKHYSTAKSVGEIATDIVAGALATNTSGNIRLAGHSLGAQLATFVAKGLSDRISAGTSGSNLAPDRLVFLDPFWSKDGKTYISGQWTGALSRTWVRDVITKRGMVLEQFKSSALGGPVGDENLEMRKMAVFTRLWPDFIGITDQTHQHVYAFVWYHQSFAAPVPAYGSKFLGAAVSDANLKLVSNWGKTSYYYYYTQSGANTNASNDDFFGRKTGVSTW